MPAGHGDLVVGQQRLDTGRGAWHRARHRQCEPAHVDRVQAVDVLVGIKLHQRRLEVDVSRRRVLEQDGVDRVVVVEAVDSVDHVLLRAVSGQVNLHRAAPQLGRLGVHHPHVPHTGVIVTDQQRRQPRNTTSVAKTIHARLQRSEHGVRNRTPGHDQ